MAEAQSDARRPVGSSGRWDPRKYLDELAITIYTMGVAPPLDSELFDPEHCRSVLPQLKAGLRGLKQHVTMVERRAQEDAPSVCAECRSRFYPSRSDAKFCGARCRQRAHRRSVRQ